MNNRKISQFPFCTGSFGGLNSNLISTIESVSKKPIEIHKTCHKVRFGLKSYVSGHFSSLEVLEVIWRFFGGHLVTKNIFKDI